MEQKRGSFTNKMGFVLAAAGSAVVLETSGVFHTWQPNTEGGSSCWSTWSWQSLSALL